MYESSNAIFYYSADPTKSYIVINKHVKKQLDNIFLLTSQTHSMIKMSREIYFFALLS